MAAYGFFGILKKKFTFSQEAQNNNTSLRVTVISFYSYYI